MKIEGNKKEIWNDDMIHVKIKECFANLFFYLWLYVEGYEMREQHEFLAKTCDSNMTGL